MAYIDNSNTQKEINDAIRGNSVSNIAPISVNNSVQPVLNVNPKDYKRTEFTKELRNTTTGTGNIFSCPTDKDTYITGFIHQYTANAASDGVRSIVQCYPTEQTQSYLSEISKIGLTATNIIVEKDFKNPIKLERGTAISTTRSFTVGEEVHTVILYGYFE